LPRPGHLSRLLNLEPGELGKLAFLWLLYLLLSAAVQVGDGVTQTLFLKRIGVEFLPYMFVVKAALDVFVAMLYVPLASRLGHPATLTLILGLAAVGLLLLWWPAAAGAPLAYPALYALSESMATLLKIHWGVLLLDCYSQEQAARTFPLIYTGARAGAVAGGLLLTGLAHPIGPANLLPVGAAVYLGAAALSLLARRHATATDTEGALARESAAGRISHIRRGLSLGLRSPLLRAIALSTALMVLCRYGLRYRYSAAFAEAFNEADLAAFYGGYAAVANGVSILVQLVITSRLLVLAGVTQTNLIYALGILAVYLALGFWPGLISSILARAMETELKAAIKTPLSNLFYGALHPSQRAAGRAFVLGLGVPVSTVVASLVLIWPGGTGTIPLWGTALALLYVVASVAQNRSYNRTMAERDSAQGV
jgi:ATP/ADP translocase